MNYNSTHVQYLLNFSINITTIQYPLCVTYDCVIYPTCTGNWDFAIIDCFHHYSEHDGCHKWNWNCLPFRSIRFHPEFFYLCCAIFIFLCSALYKRLFVFSSICFRSLYCLSFDYPCQQKYMN
jgi:hypothetical protein